MRQTLHIFKKDARGLRWEIALVLLLVAAFTLSDARSHFTLGHDQWSRILKLLVLLAWFILIARVIQSEALPGDKQFWLTRPYSWRSLLASKILFLFVFITLPMTIANSVIVTAQGFPILAHLPGLIWMQLLWWTQFIVPVAVLASITSGLATMVFWAVVIVAAGSTNLTQDLADPLGSLEWIGNSIYLTLTAAAIIFILVWQYGRRKTVDARIVFGCTMALSTLAPILPLSGVLPLREPSSLTISLDPHLPPVTAGAGLVTGMVQILFPLQIAGVPEGLTARTDSAQVRIEKADGDTIFRSSLQYPVSGRLRYADSPLPLPISRAASFGFNGRFQHAGALHTSLAPSGRVHPEPDYVLLALVPGMANRSPDDRRASRAPDEQLRNRPHPFGHP
jgi:hypothetical protein